MNASLVLPLLCLNLFAATAHARWAEPDEAQAAVNFENDHYFVRRDGSYVLTVERQIEILKDRARTDLGMTRLNYDAHAGSLKVLEAKTINKDRTWPVSASHIEIKPLASSGPGFDVTNQLTVAYPEVSVGSKLYLKYRREVKQPFVPGVFWIEEVYGWKELLQNIDITLESERELFPLLHDPGKSLALTQETRPGPGSHVIRLTLKKPLFRLIVEEEASAPDPQDLTWFSVSSLRDWADLPASTIRAYEKAIHSKLPAKFEPILNKARAAATETDQINAVTSALADTIRYVGDWVPVRGAFHPRSLDVIAKTGFGDCKDFSVTTASLLARLGFTVHAAWISRGREMVFSPLASKVLDFNHAIVRASKNGRDFWIDPTNTISYAQGIFPDIADRDALILDPRGPRLEKTGPLTHEQGRLDIGSRFSFNSQETVESQGTLNLSGLAVLPMTASALTYSKQQTDYIFVNWISNVARLLSWKIDGYDLSSRIVQDVSTRFSMLEKWWPAQTSAGTGYLVSASPFLNYFQFKRDERASGLRLPDPEVFRREYRFLGKKSILKKPISCMGRSSWIDFSREIRRDGEGLLFHEEVVLKKPLIPAADIRTPGFAQVQDELLNCLQQAVLVFE